MKTGDRVRVETRGSVYTGQTGTVTKVEYPPAAGAPAQVLVELDAPAPKLPKTSRFFESELVEVRR